MTKSTTSHQANPRVPPRDNPTTTEEKAERIARHSPEGRPAHPEVGPKQISLTIAIIVVGLLVIGVVIAAFVEPILGVALAAVGLIFFLMTPGIWASAHRAQERNALDHGEEPGRRP